MKHNFKRFLSLLLAFVMVIGMFPMTHAHAEEASVSGKQYLIVNARAGKFLTNRPESHQSASGLLLDGTLNDFDNLTIWTVTPSGDGYTVRDHAGYYLTVTNKGATVTDVPTVVKIEDNGDTKTISQNGYYLNQFGGGSSVRAAGWNGDGDADTAASDDGSQWQLVDSVDVILESDGTKIIEVDGKYTNVTGNETVGVESVYTPAGIPDGGKYYLFNTRVSKYLEHTKQEGATRLWCAASAPGETSLWTIVKTDGGYYMKNEAGHYLTFTGSGNDSSSGMTESATEANIINFEWKYGTWQIKCNNTYLNSFDSEQKVGGYNVDGDAGSQWYIISSTDFSHVRSEGAYYTKGTAVNEDTFVNGNKYYFTNDRTGTSMTSIARYVVSQNVGGTGLTSRPNANVFGADNVWTVSYVEGHGYALKSQNGEYLTVGLNENNEGANGWAKQTADESYIDLTFVADGTNRDNYWTITKTIGNTLYFLNDYNGGFASYAPGNQTHQSAGTGNIWYMYAAENEIVVEGDTTVTFNALNAGTTKIEIGGITFNFTVNSAPAAHEHSYTEEITTAATCTTDGLKTFTCECGEGTYTEVIPATGHQNTTTIPGTPATLNAPGKADAVFCNDCQTTISGGQVIPQLTVKNAQPMMDSWNSGIISLADCEYVLTGTTDAYSLSHGGNYYVKPAANGNAKPQQNAPYAGLKLQIVDGKLRIGDGDDFHLHVHLAGTAHNENGANPWWDKCSSYHADAGNGSHDFYLLKKNADSTNANIPGYEVVTSLEGAADGSYLIAFVNKNNEWFVMYPSTENVSLAKVVDGAATHTHSYTEEITPATCTTAGVKTLSCSCKHVHTEVIPATGEHNYNAVVTAPTCTEAGFTTYTCSCGDTYTEAGEPATGHSYDDGNVTTAPTCTEAGVMTYTCACGHSYTEEIKATGHSFTNYVPDNNATFDANGTETAKCDNCDATHTRDIEGTQLIAVATANGNKYQTLAEAVAVGGEVVLLANTTGDGIIIDKDVTIDLNGKTYTINGVLVGSTGTKSCGFQILSGNTVVIKNGAIVMDEGAIRGHDSNVGNNFVIQNYANLTLENVAVTGNTHTSYVVSNNSGNVVMTNTTINAPEGAVAFDVCKYLSYAEPTVTVDGCTFNGKIEAAAKVGNVYYATFEKALASGNEITLLVPVTVTKDTTYNLTGKTITSEGDIFIVTAGTLTLEGGEFKAGTDNNGTANAIWANGGHVVINGGTYSVGGDSTATEVNHQNDLIYTKNGGTVTINGGTFLYTKGVWTLNENDSNRNTITVYGGTFVGFNPANNLSEGPNTSFVAEGYCSRETDGSWTVYNKHAYAGVYTDPTFEADGFTTYTCACGHSYTVIDEGSKLVAIAVIGEQRFVSLQAAFDAAKANDTITLLDDVTLDTYLNVTTAGKIILDLAGNSITRDGNTGIYVNNAATVLTITGNGSVSGAQAVFAADGTVKIMNGTFYGTGDAIYAYGNGHIEIYGGSFSAADGAGTANEYCVLNQHDGTRETSSITVYGGTFVGFNPANNLSEGKNTNFVAEDYCSRENAGTWTVVKGHTAGEAVKENEVAPTLNSAGSYDSVVYCSACGKELSRKTVEIPVVEPKVVLHQMQAYLEAEIQMEYTMAIPEELVNAGAYVVMTKDGRWGEVTKEYKGAELAACLKDGIYAVTIGVASGEMTRGITVQVFDGEGNALTLYSKSNKDLGTSVTRTVVDFARSVLNNPDSSEARKKLAIALVTYGGYAQKNFDVSAEKPAYDLLNELKLAQMDLSEVTVDDVDGYKNNQTNLDMGVKAAQTEAVLDSYISYRVYLTVEGDISNYTFTVATPTGEKELKCSHDAKRGYYVEIPDIASGYIDYAYKLTVTNAAGDTNEITTSVLAYVRSVLRNTNNSQDKINLAKALYLYNQAADEFFGKE